MKSYLYLLIIVLLAACNNSVTTNSTIKVLPASQFNDAITDDDLLLQLIDVRTPQEYDVGHLEKSQNICFTEKGFEQKIEKLDKNKPVYVYCRRGGRSAKAAQKLRDLGFTKVYDLEGGLTSWNESGLQSIILD